MFYNYVVTLYIYQLFIHIDPYIIIFFNFIINTLVFHRSNFQWYQTRSHSLIIDNYLLLTKAKWGMFFPHLNVSVCSVAKTSHQPLHKFKLKTSESIYPMFIYNCITFRSNPTQHGCHNQRTSENAKVVIS